LKAISQEVVLLWVALTTEPAANEKYCQSAVASNCTSAAALVKVRLTFSTGACEVSVSYLKVRYPVSPLELVYSVI